jgi:hypothetical protein
MVFLIAEDSGLLKRDALLPAWWMPQFEWVWSILLQGSLLLDVRDPANEGINFLSKSWRPLSHYYAAFEMQFCL